MLGPLKGRRLKSFPHDELTFATWKRELLDAEAGSLWGFTGAAASGPLAGRRLARIRAVKDYWFDWKKYHPDTGVYLLGQRRRLCLCSFRR